MQIPTPYLIFIGGAKDALAAKTGRGIVDWRREHCVGQLRDAACKTDLGIADMTLAEGAAAGARTLVIGTVSPGGDLPREWIATLVDALALGMNVASGMHVRLTAFPELRDMAQRSGAQLIDLRQANQRFATGTGAPRAGLRLLTVGTDCSVGKKYTALALERAMRAQGLSAEYRATGQTGILIAGSGIAIDAVVADFISGAAEALSPANTPDHWDVIEGQGSLFHPSFAGVSLGLLHGSQPDAFVVCHEPTRTTMRNVDTPMPSIAEIIDATMAHGALTNPRIGCVGIAVNTQALTAQDADDYLARLAETHGLPVCDPIRQGVADIVDNLVKRFHAPTP